jgi:hypothetical protein
MRPLDEKPSTPSIAEKRARLKRRLSFFLGWLTVPVYAGAIIWIMLTWQSWPVSYLVIGMAIVIGYSVAILYVYGGISIFRSSRDDLRPTEWMRRGGLMAAPEANARPDETRIKGALGALPDDFPPLARNAVEAYLAMADDDEKQLRRDRLIGEFYELASSAKLDYAHRKAYNDLRLALSPWADTSADI